MTKQTQDAKSIFLEAIETVEPDHWNAFLNGACRGDAKLLQQVRSLLKSHQQEDSLFDRAAVMTDLPGTVSEKVGVEIGPYKLLQQIGEGGFGVVYMAEQLRPVKRKVALKIIKPGMDTKEVIARFEAERQALALMDHPNIAKVLDAGSTESGRPYFVMELVKGVPISEYCDKNNLPTRNRLELFQTVCHAVQHAHHKGIIHRDLKPSNIMVTLHDGKPVPRVIDFGVAKATSYQLTEKTLFTAYGQMVGTPAYMSPEQAEMSGLDIDTRSDIYSLGVLLYELLTGKTPFDSKQLRSAGYAEMQRIIREERPPKPSAKLSTMGDELTAISSHRSTEPKKLGQILRGDLDWIVMKALDKERNYRYESASTFAADVGRYLDGDVVSARSPSMTYRIRKFARRNKATFATGTTIALALIAGTTISTWQAIVASQQRNRAVEAEELAGELLVDIERKHERAVKAEASAKEALKETRKTIDKYVETIQNAELLKEERFKPLMRELLKDAMAHYMSFIENHEHDVSDLNDLAAALYRVALNSDLSGNTENAIQGYLKVIKIWEELTTDSSTAPDFRHNLAQSLINIGVVYQNSGELNEALPSFKKAFAILETLSAEYPMEAKYRFNFGKCQHNIGRIYSMRGEPHKARGYLLKAVEIREKLVHENPTSAVYRHDLAKDLNALAVTYQAAGNSDEALSAYKRALNIHEKHVARNPDVTEYRVELSNTHLNIGVLYNATSNPAKALESYQNSLAIREKLVKENPTMTRDRIMLSVNHHNIALLHEVNGNPNEALLSHQIVVAIMEKLVKDFPQTISHATRLGGSYVNAANLAIAIKDVSTAIQHYDSGVRTLSQVVLRHSDNQTARLFLRNAHMGRASLMQQMKRFEESVADWEKAIKYDSGQMRNRFRMKLSGSLVDLAKTEKYQVAFIEALRLSEKNKKQRIFQYNMACVASVAYESAKNDKSLSSKEKAELTNRCSRKAIALLYNAKELEFFNSSKNQELLQTDHDLDALRGLGTFQQLLKKTLNSSNDSREKQKKKSPDTSSAKSKT